MRKYPPAPRRRRSVAGGVVVDLHSWRNQRQRGISCADGGVACVRARRGTQDARTRKAFSLAAALQGASSRRRQQAQRARRIAEI